jgi:hypothetical protein
LPRPQHQTSVFMTGNVREMLRKSHRIEKG